MSRVRQVLPEQTVMVTRRTVLQMFLLHPSPIVVQTFEYLLAVACQKFGQGLWGAVMMSDHYHLGTYDEAGRLPKFTQWFDSMLARSVNSIRGRRGRFWDGR